MNSFWNFLTYSSYSKWFLLNLSVVLCTLRKCIWCTYYKLPDIFLLLHQHSTQQKDDESTDSITDLKQSYTTSTGGSTSACLSLFNASYWALFQVDSLSWGSSSWRGCAIEDRLGMNLPRKLTMPTVFFQFHYICRGVHTLNSSNFRRVGRNTILGYNMTCQNNIIGI